MVHISVKITLLLIGLLSVVNAQDEFKKGGNAEESPTLKVEIENLKNRIDWLERDRSESNSRIERLLNQSEGARRGKDIPPPHFPRRRVTAPTSGVYDWGDMLAINWSGFQGDTVSIDLREGEMIRIQTIAEAIPNNGAYAWTIPQSGFYDASDYNISVRDSHGAAVSDFFAIYPPTHSGRVTSPASEDVYYQGDTIEVIWSGFDSANVDIDLYSGNSRGTRIADETQNDGSYMWTPSMRGTDFGIVVRGQSNSRNIHARSGVFAIQARPNAGVVTNPRIGDIYYPGDTVDVMWSGFAGSSVDISVSQTHPDGINRNLSVITATSNDGSYYWTIPTNYLFTRSLSPENRLNVRDNDDWSLAQSGTFTLGKPPQNTVVTQPSGGIEYRPHDYIEVKWSGFTGDRVSMGLVLGYGVRLTLESVENDGEHRWLLPHTPWLIQSSEYRIVVYDESNLEAAESASFSIRP